MASAPVAPRSHGADAELETILTCFDTNYAWNYGSVKEGLRDLYEKAKREQWNATTQLAWDTEVDPESEIIPHMKDESRHVAFGVLSLRDYYTDMPENERRVREEFVIEGCTLMRDRLLAVEVSRYMGFDVEEVRQIVLASPVMKMFRQALFSRIVPNIRKLGLLTPRVRKAFEEMEIIHFETYDPEAADREIGLA